MNINANRLISLALLAATMVGCDFNEDFCVRNGGLVAWCDFSGITDIPPVPQDRHVIAFGTDVLPERGRPSHRTRCAGVFHKETTVFCSIPETMGWLTPEITMRPVS